MFVLHSTTAASAPRWDGSRVLFEVTASGETVECAISRMALEAIGDRPCVKRAQILSCFARARRRIEALALDKLNSRPMGVSGRVSLWADDLYAWSPAGAPAAAHLRA